MMTFKDTLQSFEEFGVEVLDHSVFERMSSKSSDCNFDFDQMDVFLKEGLLVHVFVRTGRLYASLHQYYACDLTYHYDFQRGITLNTWKQLSWPVEKRRSWWQRLFWRKHDGPSLRVNQRDLSVVDRPLSEVLSDVKRILG